MFRFHINTVKMGRVNCIGTENNQPKPLPVKIILPNHDNNNNSYKKCQKVSTMPKQDTERIIKTKAETHFSSKVQTLDIQNGNPLFHCEQTNIHISTRASHNVVTEKLSGVQMVSNTKGKTGSSSTSRKEVFHFWSTKVNGQEDGEVSPVKPRLNQDNNNTVGKHSRCILPSEEEGRCDAETKSAVMKPQKRKKRDEIFSASASRHIDEHVLATKLENLSVRDIVHKITVKCRNNIEKLRAIWIWLCHNISYDIEGYLGRSPKLYRVEDVLESRTGVCSGYAALCKAMCRLASDLYHLILWFYGVKMVDESIASSGLIIGSPSLILILKLFFSSFLICGWLEEAFLLISDFYQVRHCRWYYK
ncbi:uncharacterized protein [Pyxicephalus adspersus]|uniref:uncharacterized protein n=1 Tax=Pyxicephalus adspersus TaxID=30357 RepID=UPI003B5CC5B3